MNELQRALYKRCTEILTSGRWPSGLELTDREWWATLDIAERLANGDDFGHLTWLRRRQREAMTDAG